MNASAASRPVAVRCCSACLTGVVYPLAVTGVGQLLFPHGRPTARIVTMDGKAVGSALIGQQFTEPELFLGPAVGHRSACPTTARSRAARTWGRSTRR